MGLLAVLMEKDSALLPGNLKIVSWNYDLQMDHAVAMYKGLPNIEELSKRKELGFAPKLDGSAWNDGEFPSIIRLNGVAGLGRVGQKHHVISGPMKCLEDDNFAFIQHLFELYQSYDQGAQT